MLQRKPIPEGRECSHITCNNTCHRPQEPHRARKPIKRYSAKPKERNPDLDAWFIQRSRDLIGVCANCGFPSCKGDPIYEKFSICHILPKRKETGFPSVETHPMNYIELCFWNNSCHSNMDNKGWSFLASMKCFPLIIERFRQIYPFISDEEKKRLPEILINKL